MLHAVRVLFAWLFENGPVLLTAFGTALQAVAGFWAATLVMGKPESKIRSLAAAVLILCGALLSLAGVVGSGIQRDEFQVQIVTLNQRLAEKSDELARLNEKIASTVTGGDSYCHLRLLFATSRSLEFAVTNRGKYPLYDVRVEVRDLNKTNRFFPGKEGSISSDDLLEIQRQTLSLIPIGNMMPDELRHVWSARFPVADPQRYEVSIWARNGLVTQTLILRRAKGSWTWATQVWKTAVTVKGGEEPRKLLLEEFAMNDFPRDSKGQVQW